MADESAEYPTTIGQDANFKGQLSFEKGARLLGAFEGEITTKGELVVADGGKLAGEVSAGRVRVEGEVKGNLAVEGKVQLTASSRVEGDVQASRLEVAEGAVLIGRCAVGAESQGRRSGGAQPPVSAPADQVKPKDKGGHRTVTPGAK